MLPIKQSILLIELSYVVLSDDRLPNAIKTLLQSRILLLKILNSRLVFTGHSLFNLQRVDFITLLSLSPCHNWSGNTVAPSLTFTFRLARISFSLGWAGFFLESLSFGVLFSVFWLDLLNIQAGISPPWLSSLSLSLLPPLVLALTPGWSSAFQSGSGNIRRAPRTFPIITG